MTDAAAEDRVTFCHPAGDQMLLDFLAAQRATALDIVAGLDEGAAEAPLRGARDGPILVKASGAAARRAGCARRQPRRRHQLRLG